MAVTLRACADSDLDALFAWESDPRAVEMAAFTRADPSDRSAFDAHYERVRSDPRTRCSQSTTTESSSGRSAASPWRENGRSRTGSHRRAGAKGSHHRPSRRSLPSNRRGRSTVAWPATMPRRRRCLLERALSRWAPRRRSRRESAPRSSSTPIDSIDRRLGRFDGRERPGAVEDLGPGPVEPDEVVPAVDDRQAVRAAVAAAAEVDGDRAVVVRVSR